MDNVHALYPPKHPIRHFIRIGHTGYRTLENLLAAGRAPIRHAVMEASHLDRQQDILATLLDCDAEVILDTKSAELATPVGSASKANRLPWGGSKGPQQPSDWSSKNGVEKALRIAEFAVANRIDAVLSPAHLIDHNNQNWLFHDIQAIYNLRKALDRAGGQLIRIDYHLMMSIGLLKHFDRFMPALTRLQRAPIGNIWMRISNFGMRGSPAGTKHFIESAWKLARLKKPLIADHVGGLSALAVSAFGAVGGVCHGVAEKEHFNASYLRRPSSGGSSEKRIYLPAIDEYLYKSKVETILRGRNSRSLVVCRHPRCCSKPEDLFNQWQSHALIQSASEIEMLNSQPELKRVHYLLDSVIPEKSRNLRRISKVKFPDQALIKRLSKKCKRLELLHRTLDRVSNERDTVPIARTPVSKTRAVKRVS